jgi:hypothetical protein
MASNINYEDIDESFPRTGVDNPSQGFRDNFSVIKDSFQTAKEEISTLQSTTAKINDENDFNGNIIKQAKFVNCVQESFTRTTPSTADQIVDFINGSYQEFRLDKNTNFVLEGWPQSDGYASLRIALFSTTDVSHVATFRINGSGTISYDQETTYTEVGQSGGQTVQVVTRGMSSSQLIGPDIKVYEFWTKTNGSLVYARYLGIYNPSAPSSAGNSALSTTALSVTGTATIADTMTLSKSTGTSLDVKGDSVFEKDVVIEGNLVVQGTASASLTGVTVASLDAIGDVEISNPGQGDTLRYDSNTQKWSNLSTGNVINFTVTIDDDGSGNQPVFYFDNAKLQDNLGNQTTITFEKDTTYRFNTTDPSNQNKTLKFSTTPDILNPTSITPYTTLVSNIGIAGTSGSYTEIIVTEDTPSPLYFYAQEPAGVDTSLYGAAYPISVNNGDVKVINKKYKSIGNQRISVDTSVIGPVTIVLPSVAESTAGMYVTVIDNGNAATNNITIDRNGGTINGAAVNKIININYNSLTLISDGGGKWSVADPLVNGGIVQDTTDSATATTGALQIRGGVGISKKLNVGDDANVAGALNVAEKITLGVNEHNNQGTFDLTKSAAYSFVSGSETGILPAGEDGQVFIIGMIGAGSLEVQVVNSAWNNGSAGIIMFDRAGQSATMMYMGGRWFCIGSNGCRFGSPGNAAGATTGNSLDDLLNVQFVSPVTIGQTLKWNGLNWTNGVDLTE